MWVVIVVALVVMTVADLHALREIDREEERSWRAIDAVRGPFRVTTPYRGPVDTRADTEWDIPVAVDLSKLYPRNCVWEGRA